MKQGNYTPIHEPESDLETLLEELKVVSQAQHAGYSNIPGERQEDLDAGQSQIMDWAKSELIALDQSAKERLDEINNDLLQFTIGPADSDLDLIVNELNDQVAIGKNNFFGKLVAGWEVVTNLDYDLRRFTQQHNLVGKKIRYSSNRTGNLIFLGVLLILEALINSSFLSKGSEFGLVGGFLASSAVAAGNILISYFSGWFMRYVNHIKTSLKLLGFSCGGLWLLVMGALNLGAAHYRALLETNPSTAIFQVITNLKTDAFDITNVQSWWLLIIGVMFAGTACWKGFRIDGVYPGFSDHHRRLEDAKTNFQKTFEDLLESVTGLFDKARRDVDKKVSLFEELLDLLTDQISDAENSHSRYVSRRDQIGTTCDNLLKVYRQENLDSRRTLLNTPPCFDIWFEPEPKNSISLFNLKTHKDRRDQAVQTLHQLGEERERTLAKITGLEKDALEELENGYRAKIETATIERIRSQSRRTAAVDNAHEEPPDLQPEET